MPPRARGTVSRNQATPGRSTSPIVSTSPPQSQEANGNAPGEEAEALGIRGWLLKFAQYALMLYLFQTVFSSKSSATSTSTTTSALKKADHTSRSNSVLSSQQKNVVLRNVLEDGHMFELEVYLSIFPEVSPMYLSVASGEETVKVYGHRFPYAWDLSEDELKPTEMTLNDELSPYLSNAVRRNETIYAHARFTFDGYSKSPTHSSYRPFGSFIRTVAVTEYEAPPRRSKLKSLLGSSGVPSSAETGTRVDSSPSTQNSVLGSSLAAGSPSQHETDPESDPLEKDPLENDTRYVMYWRPDAFIRLVYDFSVVENYAFNPEIARMYTVYPHIHGYLPPAIFDDFWTLKEDRVLIDTRVLTPLPPKDENIAKALPSGIEESELTISSTSTTLNTTLPTLPFRVSYSPTSPTRLTITRSVQRSFEMQTQKGMGGLSLSDGREVDEIKRMLRDTNPILLAVTIIVTIVHMLFDYLAFSSDISFWKNQKSVVGLSVRSLFLNAISQVIIFLYLLDGDTSWTVLFSSGVGAAIECWKITKATDVTTKSSFPYFSFEEKAEYAGSETEEHDKEAFRWLSYALVPLIGGYSIYNLLYAEHKSWYSWALASLSSTVYGFGFISMCPQLYLNYKLQSVAHLPWKMLTYKALNTFVDDLFAFVIKMPMLHRIACFRDDIVFFVFLYQKWKYRTDYTRPNEFGFSFEDQTDNSEVEHQSQNKDQKHEHIENKTKKNDDIIDALPVDKNEVDDVNNDDEDDENTRDISEQAPELRKRRGGESKLGVSKPSVIDDID